MRAVALLLLIAGVAPAAAADESAQPPVNQGPMAVERSRGGWMIAPDVEVGRVGKSTETHAGAYGGWMFDNTILLGGAAYWQTDRSGARTMDYGGAIVEWLAATDHPIGFGARALLGAGSATIATTVTPVPFDGRGGRFFADAPSFGALIPVDFPVPLRPTQIRLRNDFVVFQPQADLLVNISQRLRVRAAAGYRFIGADRGWGPELRGASGSIGLEIGGTQTRRVSP